MNIITTIIISQEKLSQFLTKRPISHAPLLSMCSTISSSTNITYLLTSPPRYVVCRCATPADTAEGILAKSASSCTPYIAQETDEDIRRWQSIPLHCCTSASKAASVAMGALAFPGREGTLDATSSPSSSSTLHTHRHTHTYTDTDTVCCGT